MNPGAPLFPARHLNQSENVMATVTIIQKGSPIGRRKDQEATLIGLGLNKLHRQRTLQDTPSVRGMIKKVKHLIEIVDDAA